MTRTSDTEQQHHRRQTALYSFCGAIIVAAFIAAAWWSLRPSDAPPTAMQRRLSDEVALWRCPNGHTFNDTGSYVRIPCRECDRKADMVITYDCPEHGPREALIRIERLPDGRERLSRVSFRRGVWTDVTRVVRCPDCGAALTPAAVNLFAPDAQE